VTGSGARFARRHVLLGRKFRQLLSGQLLRIDEDCARSISRRAAVLNASYSQQKDTECKT